MMPYPLKTLKTALHLKLLIAFTLTGTCLCAQDKNKPETIFITTNAKEKPAGEKHYFAQLAISVPIRSNPFRDEYYNYTDNNGNGSMDAGERNYSALDYIWPDGLSINYGVGIHYKNWVGISANTGIDWIATGKLVTIPAYASVYFSPQIWEKTNLVLQYGHGYTFALGRGDLGGMFQKYRVGLSFNNETLLYAEVNRYGFKLYDMNPAGNISVGISITDFY
jgi:hypothetical protein